MSGEHVRELITAALDASIDRCARCKVCDKQADAVMDVFVKSASIGALVRAAGKIAEQRQRAEQAEARLAEVRKFCTGDPRTVGSLVAADILAILNPDTPAPSPEGDQA